MNDGRQFYLKDSSIEMGEKISGPATLDLVKGSQYNNTCWLSHSPFLALDNTKQLLRTDEQSENCCQVKSTAKDALSSDSCNGYATSILTVPSGLPTNLCGVKCSSGTGNVTKTISSRQFPLSLSKTENVSTPCTGRFIPYRNNVSDQFIQTSLGSDAKSVNPVNTFFSNKTGDISLVQSPLNLNRQTSSLELSPTFKGSPVYSFESTPGDLAELDMQTLQDLVPGNAHVCCQSVEEDKLSKNKTDHLCDSNAEQREFSKPVHNSLRTNPISGENIMWSYSIIPENVRLKYKTKHTGSDPAIPESLWEKRNRVRSKTEKYFNSNRTKKIGNSTTDFKQYIENIPSFDLIKDATRNQHSRSALMTNVIKIYFPNFYQKLVEVCKSNAVANRSNKASDQINSNSNCIDSGIQNLPVEAHANDADSVEFDSSLCNMAAYSLPWDTYIDTHEDRVNKDANDSETDLFPVDVIVNYMSTLRCPVKDISSTSITEDTPLPTRQRRVGRLFEEMDDEFIGIAASR